MMVNKVEIPTKTFPANQNTVLLENWPTVKLGITDKLISSCRYCMIKIPTIATIWLTVFALPQIFAAITSPVLTAIKRIEVTINSRGFFNFLRNFKIYESMILNNAPNPMLAT